MFASYNIQAISATLFAYILKLKSSHYSLYCLESSQWTLELTTFIFIVRENSYYFIPSIKSQMQVDKKLSAINVDIIIIIIQK